MTHYAFNPQKLTLTIHRAADCPNLPREGVLDCGCTVAENQGEQAVFCETHFTVGKVTQLAARRYWSILLCERCFS